MEPPSRRRFAARLLFTIGTSALAILVITGITGGFTLDLGPLHLSAHNWRNPLLIAIAAFAALRFQGRSAVDDAAAAGWQFIDDHGLALAIVFAAATAGAGIAFGTYAASSADASGYVSESRLIASASLVSDEPLARAVAWPNTTWAFSPLGYRPGTEPGELAPTYPAGLPLVIASVRFLGELAAYLVVPLLGAVAVLAAYGVGARMHSRPAGLIAAVLLATSPILLFQIVQPMSDVAVTAWWTVAILFALSPIPNGPLAAGGAAGLAVLTRPNLLPMAAVVALAVINWPRGRDERRLRRDRLIGFIAGLTPAVGAQLLMQWRLYGNPFVSGYGAAGDLFGFANIAPNTRDYAQRLLHGETSAIALAVVSIVILTTTRRGSADNVPRLKKLIVFAALGSAIVLASYLPYAVFAEWSYLRFLLPAFPLLFALAGGLFTAALLRMPAAIRTPLIVCALAAAASANVVRAENEQSFNLRRYESRYRLAGRYLASTLPSNAVVVTVQESGSVRYYAEVPILRWDLLDVDLDTAMAALRAVGRYPVLLIEDWETPAIAMKHPRSVNARLDWEARAEFGDEVRVLLYDPADRGAPRRWRADRVH